MACTSQLQEVDFKLRDARRSDDSQLYLDLVRSYVLYVFLQRSNKLTILRLKCARSASHAKIF